ncbi:DUF3885 domain-containing protein [Listeria welshimeri]|nr:DUF3885 domain-containing protein [Listeria welshimeri]
MHILIVIFLKKRHANALKTVFFNKVYFININKNAIFHIYDDNSCDLLTTSAETTRDVYKRHN